MFSLGQPFLPKALLLGKVVVYGIFDCVMVQGDLFAFGSHPCMFGAVLEPVVSLLLGLRPAKRILAISVLVVISSAEGLFPSISGLRIPPLCHPGSSASGSGPVVAHALPRSQG